MLLIGFGTYYAGGTVTFKNAGLDTLKDAYSDTDMVGTVSNPYTLDAYGRSGNPIYGSGWYKLVITSSDGTGILTFDNMYYSILEQTDPRDPTVRAITLTGNIISTDDAILADASTGSIIATLPDAGTLTSAKVYYVQKTDATVNTVTIKGNGVQTINGANTFVLTFQYATAMVIRISATQWAMFQVMRERTSSGAGLVPIADASGHIDDDWLTLAMPVGTMAVYGGAAAPDGWLLCNGAAVSRVTYANLFAVVAETYGVGDGLTTFNLPNGLGRSLIGAGAGAGLTVRACGDSGGAETHQLVAAEMPSHSHSQYFGDSTTMKIEGAVGATWSPDKVASDSATIITTSGAGADGAHNNMQPYFVGTWIIKY